MIKYFCDRCGEIIDTFKWYGVDAEDKIHLHNKCPEKNNFQFNVWRPAKFLTMEILSKTKVIYLFNQQKQHGVCFLTNDDKNKSVFEDSQRGVITKYMIPNASIEVL